MTRNKQQEKETEYASGGTTRERASERERERERESERERERERKRRKKKQKIREKEMRAKRSSFRMILVPTNVPWKLSRHDFTFAATRNLHVHAKAARGNLFDRGKDMLRFRTPVFIFKNAFTPCTKVGATHTSERCIVCKKIIF